MSESETLAGRTATMIRPALPGRLKKVADEQPAKLWTHKIGKSLAGVVVAGVGLYLRTEQPPYVWLPIFGFGCHIFSEDWTRSFVDFAVGAFSRVWRLVKGKNGG